MEEYSAAGEILTTIQVGVAGARTGSGFISALMPTLSYRGFEQHWIGCPSNKPDIVAKSSGKGTAVYVSWNGATEVEAWEIYGGSSQRYLNHLATVARSGFETSVDVQRVRYVYAKPRLTPGCSCKEGSRSNTVAVT